MLINKNMAYIWILSDNWVCIFEECEEFREKGCHREIFYGIIWNVRHHDHHQH